MNVLTNRPHPHCSIWRFFFCTYMWLWYVCTPLRRAGMLNAYGVLICRMPARNIRSIEAWKQTRMFCSIHIPLSLQERRRQRYRRYRCYCDNLCTSKRWIRSYFFLLPLQLMRKRRIAVWPTTYSHTHHNTAEYNLLHLGRATRYNVTCLLRQQTNLYAFTLPSTSCHAYGPYKYNVSL